jgi:D-amino-acid dehydrogenase
MTGTVVVLGAGIVGVACALELQRRGRPVILVDRREPGRETSWGNAGVLARSSLVPLNHPGLWAALPTLLRNRSAALRYSLPYLARELPWTLRFLAHARRAAFAQTCTALDDLIHLSIQGHRQLLAQAGAEHHLRENGWLLLYRSEAAWAAAAFAREIFARFDIATEALDASGLAGLEPSLRPIFPRALWVRDSASVDDPGEVVQAYLRLFTVRGGTVLRREVRALQAIPGGWRTDDTQGGTLQAAQVVVALGPWSKELLATLGLHVPMAFERGYHLHYGAAEGAHLGRPVHDTGGGYVLSPMAQGLRLTTGIELNDLEAPSRFGQLNQAEKAAREAFPLGRRLNDSPWRGARPTLPDSRPMIGEAPHYPGLWLAFGHQHVGFGTAPGTAAVLVALMAGETPPIDAQAFQPGRFLR